MGNIGRLVFQILIFALRHPVLIRPAIDAIPVSAPKCSTFVDCFIEREALLVDVARRAATVACDSCSAPFAETTCTEPSPSTAAR